ncbi:MAG TPA: helix-turn-helix domain-containing protein [Blastocatellia bacterium]|nr:helix-turn-helix domain-containing protein [Blastocatellia bacterium]
MQSSDDSALYEWFLKSNLASELFANKWRIVLLCALAPGTVRYSELRNKIGKLSHPKLAQTLRSLERDGLVLRRTHKAVPPRVEYSLTPLGQSLLERLAPAFDWAREHETEIAAQQSSFDQKEMSWWYSTEADEGVIDEAASADSSEQH